MAHVDGMVGGVVGGVVGGIVLAAGSSSRYGRDKRQVPLASGQTILESTISNAAAALDHLLVVLGHGDHDYAAELATRLNPDIRFLCAHDSALGMAHSLANGVKQVTDWRAALIILGDLPFIQDSTIKLVVTAYREAATAHPIVLPRYRGRQGHPVLFDQAYFKEIGKLTGDAGARSVIRAHSKDVIEIEVDDPGILQDIDRPRDLPTARS